MDAKLKGVYLSSTVTDVIPKMATRGCNLALVKFRYYPDSPVGSATPQEWAAQATAHRMEMFAVLNYWDEESTWITKTTSYHSGCYGIWCLEDPTIPCPLDPDVYRKSIHDRFLSLARLSLTCGINGLAVDMECYKGTNNWIYFWPCVCDTCWNAYMTSHGIPHTIAKASRGDYLKDNVLYAAYNAYQRDRMKAMVAATRLAVWKINPALQFGALVVDYTQAVPGITIDPLGPVGEGYARGLTTTAKPFLNISEQMFDTGYPLLSKLTQFKQFGIPCVQLGGLRHSTIGHSTLAQHIFYTASAANGWWDYAGASFTDIPGQKEESVTPNEALYLAAINSGNTELENCERCKGYKTTLTKPT